ncbi:Carbonic anhydrase [Candidatus Bilamarchaeum dharawalense]|uniref:Carbonic anhydrase n=1 Tax=Candidatus Bilamarchaeum dharawalense TaxID=2885759 RepID=A0A5E4LTH0_9ARCH|nr:Carbonic anhydrase [Candidatus Bilamarchaeum dharawalense]
MIHKFQNKKPVLKGKNFIAESAEIIGEVEIGTGTSVWFNAVLRGDIGRIKIGKNVSVQDGCVLHTQQGIPIIIGDDVAIGHGALLHSCTIGKRCIIGMGAIILTNAKIGDNCIIGAGSVVTEGSKIPDGSIVMGIPGKIVKKTTKEHKARIKRNIEEYIRLNREYLIEKKIIG